MQLQARDYSSSKRDIGQDAGFLRTLLDAQHEQMAVVDAAGTIVLVNAAWRQFARCNGFPSRFRWLGVNYLAVCEASATAGDPDGERAAMILREVLSGARVEGAFEYPCHGPDCQRWFSVRMVALSGPAHGHALISHHEVTPQKLAEMAAERLSLEDSLTGIANRRGMDRFLASEWRRCVRDGASLSVLLIDIDHFKRFNDRHGHPTGDMALQCVAQALRGSAARPTDLAARWGGEEFVVAMGRTEGAVAMRLAERIRRRVDAAARVDKRLPAGVTVSIGASCVQPSSAASLDRLLATADEALYRAKRAGRNQVCFMPASDA